MLREDAPALPLVSVVVPVFDGEQYLRESLESILRQTYPRTEILVMDDASTDGTGEVALSFGDKVRYYRQPRNRGIYGNMNDGIAMAAGDFIAIYHADDIYHPEIIERETQFLRRYPQAGAVFCKDIFIDPQGKERGRLELPPEARGGGPFDYALILNTLLMYKNHIFRCPSCMVRASVYRELGGYRDVEFLNSSDLEMYLRIAKHYSVGILDDFLFSYRWGHGNSGQRYRHLRTNPNRFFEIIDLYLSEGGNGLVTPEALTDYGAHRAEDNLMRAVNYYILGQHKQTREVLSLVRMRQLVASGRIQRGRLLVLFFILHCLVRIPKVPLVAKLFYQRWHTKPEQKRPFTVSTFITKNHQQLQARREGWR